MDDANIDPFRAAPLAERPRCLVAPPRRNGPKTHQGYACLRASGRSKKKNYSHGEGIQTPPRFQQVATRFC